MSMARMIAAIPLALAFVSTVGVHGAAIPQGTDASRAATITAHLTLIGCLLRGPEGQFHLTNALAAPNRNVTDPRENRPLDGLAWSLSGAADLKAYLGQRVQVTGSGTWDPTVAASTAPTAPQRDDTATAVRSPGRADRSSASAGVVVPANTHQTTLSESAFDLHVESIHSVADACIE